MWAAKEAASSRANWYDCIYAALARMCLGRLTTIRGTNQYASVCAEVG
jgi:hypothetical protein